MTDQGKLPELPQGWVWTRLGEVCDVNLGKTPKKSQYLNGGKYRIVKFRDLKDGAISYDESDRGFVSEAEEIINELSELQEKDVLIGASAHSSEQIGRKVVYVVSIPKQYEKVFFVGELLCLRSPENNIEPRIIYYFLLSQDGYKAIQSHVRGVHLIASEARQILIPVPPFPEQHRIVAKIEELFTKIDAAVEALNKVKSQVKFYRQAVLKHAFEGKLTEEWREAHKGEMEPASVLLERIREERQKSTKGKAEDLPPIDTSDLPELPEGWIWARIEEVGEVETGTTPSKSKAEYYGRDYCFYKPTDLDAGYYTRDSRDWLSSAGLREARLLPKRSILVTCIGATIGKTGFIRREGASNQQINAIIPHDGISQEYVYFICVSPQFQRSIIQQGSATTLPILSKRKFEVLPLPIPPFAEQRKIVEEIERYFSVADQIEEMVERGLKQAERLRQSILKRAFEGKLVPQDPSEEPAEKLLERIKAEKESIKDKSARSNQRQPTAMQGRLI